MDGLCESIAGFCEVALHARYAGHIGSRLSVRETRWVVRPDFRGVPGGVLPQCGEHGIPENITSERPVQIRRLGEDAERDPFPAALRRGAQGSGFAHAPNSTQGRGPGAGPLMMMMTMMMMTMMMVLMMILVPKQ